ncbi:MAG: Crp/Fnr family transcriptional regulator, partial [Gammaproteobacteria bacterium]
QPHDMTVLPDGDIEVLSSPIETMRQWLWQYPELNRNFMPYLAQRMRDQEDMTANIALYDTVSRLSRLILKHATLNRDYHGKESDAHKTHLINGFSDEMLARMIGSVRQVVNKHLQFWQRSGVLSKQRHSLEIKNLQELEGVAHEFLDKLKKSA